MRKILLLLGITSFVFATAQRPVLYSKRAETGCGRAFSRAAIADDMNFWLRTIEETHVNPYHAISKNSLLTLRDSLAAALPDSISSALASFTISRLAGALDEGHIGLATDACTDSLYTNHAERFPYQLQEINDSGLVVRTDFGFGSMRLPSFSRILSVNGHTAGDLYKRYALLSGGLTDWKKLMVTNDFRKLLFMDGIISPFPISAISGSDTVSLTARGYQASQMDSIRKLIAGAGPVAIPAFSFQWLAGNIAYIAFNDMDGSLKDSFAVFLDKTFTEIKKNNATELIIDLRKNGGGDSDLGDLLLSYTTARPYRNAGGVKVRISAQARQVAALRGEEYNFATMKDGDLYNYLVKQKHYPTKQVNRFNGKTIVLIGTGTFSSANMLANAISDFKLATLLGEPTAEPANDFGEIFWFMLPNTCIVATGATKMFIRANGDDTDFRGIQPDILSKPSATDLSQGIDRPLQDAIRIFQIQQKP